LKPSRRCVHPPCKGRAALGEGWARRPLRHHDCAELTVLKPPAQLLLGVRRDPHARLLRAQRQQRVEEAAVRDDRDLLLLRGTWGGQWLDGG